MQQFFTLEHTNFPDPATSRDPPVGRSEIELVGHQSTVDPVRAAVAGGQCRMKDDDLMQSVAEIS